MEVLFAQLNVVHGMLSFSVAKTPFVCRVLSYA